METTTNEEVWRDVNFLASNLGTPDDVGDVVAWKAAARTPTAGVRPRVATDGAAKVTTELAPRVVIIIFSRVIRRRTRVWSLVVTHGALFLTGS